MYASVVHLYMAAAPVSPAPKHSIYEWLIPAISAVSAILIALFGYFRGRRTDTITLYSAFVDDLHSELERVRSQSTQDQNNWASERSTMKSDMATQGKEVVSLQRRLKEAQDELRRLKRRSGGPES